MITFDHLTYSYPAEPDRATTPVLADVCLSIDEGEFVLVVGPSGSGKSTLLRCINGLVPHFYGGRVSGRIRVAGRDPVALEPRRMTDVVGFVFQDPEAQAVVDLVEDELVFAMENHGLPRETMRTRVEEVLDQLNIAALRRRRLTSLSGGERQRVAIAAVLTLHPNVLVLDEPTSQLDPQAAEEVLDALRKLNDDLGLTILLAEHRLERVAQYADRILYMPGPGLAPSFGVPDEVLAQVPLVPPLIELGRRLGWEPLPLTIREARRRSRTLRAAGRLADRGAGKETETAEADAATDDRLRPQPGGLYPDPVIEMCGVRFSYDGRAVLRGVDLSVGRGEFVAVMGRNGAGKSTLLKHCIALLHPREGQVRVLGHDTRRVAVEELARVVGYVPQNPNALLFADTVADELAFTRRVQGLVSGEESYIERDEQFLERLGLGGMAQRCPRDLSGGERQRVALAAVLVGDPELVLLDEPTRGLDYEQKRALVRFLALLRVASRGGKHTPKTILMVTHDVELVAQCAERVILMGDGEIVVDGPVRQVMNGSQVFASQINKLFRDPRFLTVDDVMASLSEVDTASSAF
jgi:energy-coupling factor transport system ATP-binding protein